jgi:hypothetical protein
VELIKSAELLRGQIRLDGLIDGEPFHLKLEGRELKIEGLSLTAEQREALVAELRGISGLREAKIEALVDGKRTVTKLEGDRREKFEIRDRDRGREDRPERERGDDRRSGELRHPDDTGRTANAEIRERVDRSGPGRDGVERTESSGRR